MSYREIRVRPVVRYIVTDFQCDDDMKNAQSQGYGIFENAHDANKIGELLAEETDACVFEPVRPLKIDWLRGPNEPLESIRWVLEETE